LRIDYKITVKPYVDFIHVVDCDNSKYVGLLIPAEDCPTMILRQYEYKTFVIKLPQTTQKIKLELLGYGKVGGETAYSINYLISVGINNDTIGVVESKNGSGWVSPIIVNTPFQIKGVMIQVNARLRELTGLPEYIRPITIDRTTLRDQYKHQPSEFASRGIDITGKTWFAQVPLELPDWAITEKDEFLRILKLQLPAVVHCFSLIGNMELDVHE